MNIKINDKVYVGQCNALSYLYFKRLFNKNIMDELNKMRECLFYISKEEDLLKKSNEVDNILIRLIYTLIYTKNQNIISFSKFESEVKNTSVSIETINEVISIFINAFIDEELIEEMKKLPSQNDSKARFLEHDFLYTCFKNGITIEALKELTYNDVMKILVTSLISCNSKKTKKVTYRKATQKDWDRLAGGV